MRRCSPASASAGSSRRDGWVAWPGPALADFLRQFIAHNRMLEGGFVIEDRLVTLADITCPVLSVVGTVDQIAPAAGVRAIAHAAPRAEVYELPLDAGHFGLVVGSVGRRAHLADGRGVGPVAGRRRRASARRSGRRRSRPRSSWPSEVRSRVGYGLELAGGVGGGNRPLGGLDRRAAPLAARGSSHARRPAQLPRLARLEQIQPGTRISLGLLVEERRRRAPDEVFFLYEDRAYTAADFNERIDNVVRGLIEVGVRQGEHVGVLMGSRPSARRAGDRDQPARRGRRC